MRAASAARAGASASLEPPPSPEPIPEPVCAVCPYGLTARCEGFDSETAAGGEREGVIGCFDPARQGRYYRDLHRGDFETDSSPLGRVPPLPAFIPVLVRVLPAATRLPALPLYGVGWTTVIRRGGEVRYDTPERMRRQLALRPDARICLVGTARDDRLERAWEGSEAHGLWDRLAALSFAFATTTTFSVWERQPRFDQIFNQERNLYSYSRLARLGLPGVPFLFYRTAADLRAAADWLRRHREVETVGMLAQFYRSTEAFERLMAGMEALTEATGRSLRFLVTGCSMAVKIERLFARFPTATVVSTQPVMQALHGRALTPGLRPEKASRKIPRHELLAKNVARFADFCAQARPLSALPA